MLNIYTVSFFGHRELTHFVDIQEQLEKLIRQLLEKKEYVEFLVGRNGAFDSLVSSVIRMVKREYRDDNSCHILVLPYYTKEYSYNISYFEKFFDEVEICKESENAFFKSAIQIRNKNMVDRSDLTVFYIEKESGGAYSTYKYAQKHKKEIIKISSSL